MINPMKIIKVLLIIQIFTLLQGCAAVAVVGGAGAISSATDRRTLGTQIDDNTIEIKAKLRLAEQKELEKHCRVIVKSVNGQLLVIGQTATDFLRQKAIQSLQGLDGVKAIHNQLKVSSTTAVTTRTMDSWLTTRVKLKLLTEKSLKGDNISVITENAEVYLMGLVTPTEADKAVEIARNIPGVAKVIKVFEFI